jgi:hypothetical protein
MSVIRSIDSTKFSTDQNINLIESNVSNSSIYGSLVSTI